MLRKRISSILVAGVVTLSMTGCNMKDTYKQILEQELQRIESTEPIKYELPHMEQEAKDIESKVEQSTKVAEPKQQSENNKSNDEKTLEQEAYDAGYELGNQIKEQLEKDGKYEEFINNYENQIDGDEGIVAPDETEKEIENIYDAIEETYSEPAPQPEPQYKSNEETNTSDNEPTNSPEVAEQYMRENNLEEVNY